MNTNSLRYAGFWPRLGSLLLDVIIMLPLSALVLWANGHCRLFMAYYLIPETFLGLFYSVYLVRRYGGTPGKLIVGIRIRKLDGEPVGYREAFLRYLPEAILYFLLSISLLFPLFHMSDAEYRSFAFLERFEHMIELAPFWYKPLHWVQVAWVWGELIVLLTNRKRRALHDFIAGTVVVHAPPNHLLLPTTGFWKNLRSHSMMWWLTSGAIVVITIYATTLVICAHRGRIVYNSMGGGEYGITLWYFDSDKGEFLFAIGHDAHDQEQIPLSPGLQGLFFDGLCIRSFDLRYNRHYHPVVYSESAQQLSIDDHSYDLRQGRVFIFGVSGKTTSVRQVQVSLDADRLKNKTFYLLEAVGQQLEKLGMINSTPSSPATPPSPTR